MADNVTLPGASQIIATDEIDGVQYQRIKPAFGPDGAAVDVSADNPLPVAESGPLITLFVRLLNMLGAPVGYDKSLQRYRQTTVIENGTITVVNSVSSVANQVAIGGVQGQILVNGGNLAAWQASVRARIS